MREEALLAATNQPRELVSRSEEMHQIRQAIYQTSSDCHIVLIAGPGGLGKTRMIEEALRRLGHESMRQLYGRPADDWQHQFGKKAIACNLLDFSDIRLHSRDFFLETIGSSLTWNGVVEFSRHEMARARQRRLMDAGAAYSLVEKATEAAEIDFRRDYHKAAGMYRLVIPLDTTEQLSIISSGWLLERQLLEPKEIAFSTQQWLVDQIEYGRFPNSTLLIAGREEEGEHYFAMLSEAVEKASKPTRLTVLNLEPFGEAETRSFFVTLRDDWQKRPQNNLAQDVADTLDVLIDDEEQLRLLHLYTGGQPIRLSLYTDILIEGRTIPEPLQDSLLQAYDRVGSGVETDEMLTARQEIEGEFVRLLFSQPGLRSQILQALVRATRGLKAEQLHFVLDSKPDDKPEAWQPDQLRLAEIEAELAAMQSMSLIKQKSGGRTGLQDEVYRIYAEHMNSTEDNRRAEMVARQQLYLRLRDWADSNRQRVQAQRTAYIRHDLGRIRQERPSTILNTHMPKPTAEEELRRNQLLSDLQDLDLEYLHYNLLLNPDTHFNDTYYSLANKQNRALNVASGAVVQSEVWRLLQDKFAFAFVELEPRSAISNRGESPAMVLHRAAQQDDAATWILRFWMTKQYQRAVHFADAVDTAVSHLTNEHERHSWQHTFARSQRHCWRELARIYLGEGIPDAVSRLQIIVSELTQLAQADIHTEVFPGENGFVGHPAYPRLIFTIANCYTVLGNGLTILGDYRDAVAAYGAALKYLRQLPPTDQQASTLNNLAQTLVEMGKKRAIRVCNEGLQLRLGSGELLPIAGSYNTLGQIMNELHRSRESLQASATAFAIAAEIGDSRTTGLSMMHIAEGLRRLVREDQTLSNTDVDEIYRTAEHAVGQAQEIFMASNARHEAIRVIEINIETGCLYRDWLARTAETAVPDIWQQRLGRATYFLNSAVKGAQQLGLIRFELDALVNLAWTHYFAHDWDGLAKTLAAADTLFPPDVRLRPDEQPPDTQDKPHFFFQHLSKLHSLNGRIAFDNYFAEDDPASRAAQHHLAHAAEAYVLSLGYAQLFSPRSVGITAVYDALYDYLKQLDATQLTNFYRYEQQQRTRYRLDALKGQLENLGDLQDFLLDCFGDYYSEI
ncbi:MAG: ATP-binding protein [Anaerolineales bacterium]|nr:ATP-binding protein [Anaerolineales bacterium]